MSKDTLQKAQQKAAQLLNINFEQFDAAQRPTIHHLGDIKLKGGKAFPAYRGYSGPSGLIGKGGIRMAVYPESEARTVIGELSSEMYAKLILRGYHNRFRGAKGLIIADSRSLSHTERREVMRQFAVLMDSAHLACHVCDIPAGDIGTNDLLDTYVDEYARLHANDPYKKAVITGKSPLDGGLAFRVPATGWGVYTAHAALLRLRGIDSATASVQGFGTVGAWYAHFASQEAGSPVIIKAISDFDGTISTDDKNGFQITTEMIATLSDPDFHGQKVHELAKLIVKNQPELRDKITISKDPGDILMLTADYFVPAAFGNVITKDTVHTLGATRGVIEAANGPTSGYAHDVLIERGLDVLPDIVANGGGVSVSIMEYDANIAEAKRQKTTPTTAELKEKLRIDSNELVKHLLEVDEKYETNDMRVAAAIIIMQAR